MIKSLIAAVVLLAFGFVHASASDQVATAGQAANVGRVVSIEGNTVKIEITGELPSWARKGGHLRATDGDGKLILRGARITEVEGGTVIITTTKANELTVGATYTVGRGRAAAGC